MFLALQQSTVPEQFGAVMLLEPREGFDVALATRVLADRVRGVPRMRQRVVAVPPLCGRPVWTDEAGFSIEQHVEHVECPRQGDEGALLDIAASRLVRALPPDRPLWAATFVTGLDGGRVALILVVQHALADGIGGLAVLGALVDGAPVPAWRPFPMPLPPRRRLAADAFLTRGRAIITAPARIRRALGDLRLPRGPRIGRAAACSLLLPAGPRRRIMVARAPLDALRDVAHQHGATVNDVVLTAVGGALHATVGARGEHLDAVVVAVPATTRQSATTEALGNRFREIRAAIPAAGDPLDRLERVAAIMRTSKAAPSPVMGSLATSIARATVAVGFHDWYLRRQRYIHTVVSNVRGPAHRVTLCGAPISEVLPIAVGGGSSNVTVTFAVLSYAGTVGVTVTADPDRMPDLAATTTALQEELDALAAHVPG